MTRGKKIALAAAVGVVALALLLAALGPRLVDSAPVRERLVALVFRATGGEVAYDRVDLAWLPRPRLVFRRTTVRLPGRIAGAVEALTVEPEILPLLTGQVRVGALRLDAPAVVAPLPERFREPGEEAPTLASVEEKIALLLSRIAQKAPGLVVTAEEGRLALYDGDRAVVSLRDLRGRVTLPPKTMSFELTCRSDLGERLALTASLDPDRFRGEGTISAERLRPHSLLARLVPEASWTIGEGLLDARVRLVADGIGTLRAEVEATVSSLTLRRGTRTWALRDGRLKAEARAVPGRLTLSATDLSVGSPRLALSGTIDLDRASRRAELDLLIREAEVASLRAAALALAGDLPPVRKLCGVMREGWISRARVRSGGRSAADLGALGNVVVEGHLERGRIVVPGIDLDLRSVRGAAALSAGILSAKGIEARLGNAVGREGAVRVGLEGKGAPLSLDVRIDADLAELPPLLSGIVEEKSFKDELALVEQLEGRASGRLVLGGTTDDVRIGVDVTEMRGAGKYARIPLPVRVSHGRLSYDGQRVSVEALEGRIGASAFEGVSARVALGKGGRKPVLESFSGDLVLRLGELHPWVASLERAGKGLRRVSRLEGSVRLKVAALEGPLAGEGAMRLDASGEVEGIEAEAPWWPGTLSVTGGTFRAGTERISIRGIRAALLDATLEVSGEVRGFAGGTPEMDLTCDGPIGPEANGWLSGLLGVPEELRLRSPLSLSRLRLARDGTGKASVEGRILFDDGPEVAVDLEGRPGAVDVRSLSIRHGESRSSLSLRRRGERLGLAFSGRLGAGSVDRILATPTGWRGDVHGDLRADIDLARPTESTFQGSLQGRAIDPPARWIGPATIEAVSLEGAGGAIRVKSADLVWLEQAFSLAGEVRFVPGRVLLDVDLASPGVEADRILEFLARRGQPGGEGRKEAEEEGAAGPAGVEGGGRRPGAAPRLAVEGTVRLRAESFRWRRFLWKPLHADVAVERGTAKVDVKRAELCGLSTTGVIASAGGRLSLDVRIAAEGGDIEPTLVCLTERTYEATGTFRFAAHLMGTGEGGALLKALRGDVAFSAEKGRIRRFDLLGKVLGILNLTELVRGKLPDLREGIAYNVVTIKGTLAEGRFAIRDAATLEGPSLGIAAHGGIDIPSRGVDLVVLVSPFRTADWIIRNLPIVGYIFKGRLVAVPVRVEGRLDDPDVRVLPASEVGAGLLGILERTLKAPIQIMAPIVPGGGTEKPAAGE